MKKNINSPGLLMLSVIILLMGISRGLSADTSSSVFNFTATLVGGSCEISVPASIQFNGGDLLSFSDIKAAGDSGTTKTLAAFNLTLNNCSGWGLVPKIKVSGQTTTAFGKVLFRNADELGPMDSYGFGVFLMTNGNDNFNTNADLGANGDITPKSWTSTTELSKLNNSTLPIRAIISCGSCSESIDYRGGDFKATVTFDFIYE